MNTICDLNKNIALQASAGSGKTYSLSSRFINLLLHGAAFPEIVAITFTNKAANEMKERVIQKLKKLSMGDIEEITFFSEITGISDVKIIKNRAEKIYSEIFENYSDVKISTIHSFLNRMLCLFSLEFGMGYDLKLLEEGEELFLFDEIFMEWLEEAEKDKEFLPVLQDIFLSENTSWVDIEKPFYDTFRSLKAREVDFHTVLPAALKEKISRYNNLIADAKKEIAGGSFLTLIRSFSEKMMALKGLQKKEGGGNKNMMSAIGKVEKFLKEPSFEKLIKTDIFFWSSIGGKQHGKHFINSLEERKMFDEIDKLTSLHKNIFNRAIKICGDYIFSMNQAKSFSILMHFLAFIRMVRDAKIAKGLIDFSDMENIVYRGIVEGKYMVDANYLYFKLDGRVKHLLIDEFQDTNPVQWLILKPFVEEILSGTGSFFYVGDEKQAIYRFRKGTSSLFSLVGEKYPSILNKQLLNNYRSGSAIIDFTNKFFEQVFENYLKQNPGKPEQEGKGYVRIEKVVSRESSSGEAVLNRAAGLIEELIAKGYRLNQIALIFRSNSTISKFEDMLNKRGIPYISESSGSLLDVQEVQDVISLLKFCTNPGDDISLISFLKSKAVSIDERRLFDLLKIDKKNVYFKLESSTDEDLTDIKEKLKKILNHTDRLSVSRLIYELLHTFNFYGIFRNRFYNLEKLIQTAIDFESKRGGTVLDFVNYLEKRRDSIKRDTPTESGEESITLATVHKVKGLEFDFVILPEVNFLITNKSRLLYEEDENLFTKGIYIKESKERMEFSEKLTKVSETEFQKILNDEKNIFYVAVTRAVKGLFLITNGKKYENSWYKWLADVEDFGLKGDTPALEGVHVVYESGNLEPAEKERKRTEDEKLLKVRFDFEYEEEYGDISPSGAVEKEYFEDPYGEGKEIGTAVHLALSNVGVIKRDEDISKAVDDAICKSASALSLRPELMPQCRALVNNAFNDEGVFRFFEKKNVINFKNEAPLYFFDKERKKYVSGIIDRIVETSDKIFIIDYKTNPIKNREELESLAGVYKTQINYYVKGIKMIYGDSKPVKPLFIFLSAGKGERVVEVKV